MNVIYEGPDANGSAFAIVQSVITDERTQSYVAQCYPRWFESVFERDKANA